MLIPSIYYTNPNMAVVINNNSGLTEAHYSNTNLSEIYVGRHLVWPVSEAPTPMIGDKIEYTLSGSTYTIPCNETDVLTRDDIYVDLLDRGDLISDISGITDAVIGSCVTELNDNCFNEALSLTSVTIPSTVNVIGNSAFYICHSLPTLTIPNGVKKIPYHMCAGCTELSNTNIPYGVTEIGVNAYYDCLSLMNITIPSTVTKIGDNAFRVQEWTKKDQYQYNKMLNVAKNRVVICLPTTPPILGDGVFSIITGQDEIATYPIYVPSNSLEAYKAAPNWSYIADRIMPMV